MAKQSVDGSVRGAKAVTPSDTVDIPVTDGIYIGTTGNLAVVMEDGNTVTYTSIAAGICHPLGVTRVNSTNTTASNIVALYYQKA
jgi:hypothetical protein